MRNHVCGPESSPVKVPVFRTKRLTPLKPVKLFDSEIFEQKPLKQALRVPELKASEPQELKPASSFDAWPYIVGDADEALVIYSNFIKIFGDEPTLMLMFLDTESGRIYAERFESALKCMALPEHSIRSKERSSEDKSTGNKITGKGEFQPVRILSEEPLLLTLDLSWFEINKTNKQRLMLKDMKKLLLDKSFRSSLKKIKNKGKGVVMLLLLEINVFRDVLYEMSKKEKVFVIAVGPEKSWLNFQPKHISTPYYAALY